MNDLNEFTTAKMSQYLQKLIIDTNFALYNINTTIESIKTTQNTILTLSEHPRINGILQIDDNFAFPGQVNTSGEVFLTIGDYKISLTPQQAIKHLENRLKVAQQNRDVCLKETANLEEKLKVSEEVFGQKQIGEEIRVDDRTIGMVFERGEFFEIVEFQQDDRNSLEAKFDGLKVSEEKKKRVSKVKNEEEKQLWLKKNR